MRFDAFCEPPLESLFANREGTLGHKWRQRPFTLSSIGEDRDFYQKFVIVGFPDDRGIQNNGGRPGAKDGPTAFRKAFYKLYDTPQREFCLESRKFLSTKQSQNQPKMISDRILDLGDVKLKDSIEESHEGLAQVVSEALKRGAEMVFVVGGGHDFTYGSYLGHVRGSALGRAIPIINLDAHLDLRPVENRVINSGTPFYRIIEELGHAIQKGKGLLELGIQRDRNPESLYRYAAQKGVGVVEYNAILDEWLEITHGRSTSPLDHLLDHLDRCHGFGWDRLTDFLHLSIDLDVFHQATAPGTSASTPFGVLFRQFGEVFSFLGRTRFTRVVDVAELSPAHDVGDQTAKLAAGLVYQLITLRQEHKNYSGPVV
jgi:formiminoglutamase